MRTPKLRLIVLVAAAAALPLFASPAHAQSGVKGAFRMGGDFGGEKVMEFEYEDGSTPDVKAGNGAFCATLPIIPASSTSEVERGDRSTANQRLVSC